MAEHAVACVQGDFCEGRTLQHLNAVEDIIRISKSSYQ